MPMSIGIGVVSVCALLAAAIGGFDATQNGPPVIIGPSPLAAGAGAPAIADQSAEYRIDGGLLTIVKDGQSHGWVKCNAETEPDDQAFSVRLPVSARADKAVKYSAKKAWQQSSGARPNTAQYARSSAGATVSNFINSVRSKTRFDSKPIFQRSSLLRSLATEKTRLQQFLNSHKTGLRQQLRAVANQPRFSQ